MDYQPRSVYEFEDEPRPASCEAPIIPIVLAAPRPIPATPTFEAVVNTVDGETYHLTYRLEQRPAAWVGVLESCRRQGSERRRG
jgi:hypothetical protein